MHYIAVKIVVIQQVCFVNSWKVEIHQAVELVSGEMDRGVLDDEDGVIAPHQLVVVRHLLDARVDLLLEYSRR